MVEAWTWSAVVGVVLGVAVAVVLFVPTLAWESRRFGRLRWSRTVAAGAAAVYGVTVLAYTFLPLPGLGWCATHTSPPRDLRPFHSVEVIARAAVGLSPRGLLISPAFLQVAMNVVLFVPWGAFARRLFGLPAWAAVLSGCLCSVVIEATQGTAVWGLFACVFRSADIDDVITNTTGAAVGALLAPLLLRWVPDARSDLAHRGDPRPVDRPRRLLGMLIDAGAFFGTWVALQVAWRGWNRYGRVESLPNLTAARVETICGVAAFLAAVVLPRLVGTRASVGQRAMWLAPAPGDRGLGRAVLRTTTGFGGYAALALVGSIPRLPDLARHAADLAGWVLLATAVLAVLADPQARGVSFRISDTALVDRREPAAR